MTNAFESLWRLHRSGAPVPPVSADVATASSTNDAGASSPSAVPFDGDVKVGDIRIFADLNRPFTALIVEARGLLGYRAVPVSPFPVPASPREYAADGRVFQLWNACMLSKSLAGRSWLVARLDASAVSDIMSAMSSANPGRLTAGDSIQALYEREFLVAGGSLRPLGTWLPGTDGVRATRGRAFFTRLRAEAWKIAASVAICLGTFYFVLGSGRTYLRAWRERLYAISPMVDEQTVELAEIPAMPIEADGESTGSDDELERFRREALLGAETEPLPGFFFHGLARDPADMDGTGRSLGERTRRIAEIPFRPIRLPASDSLVDPHVMPLSVLDAGPLKPLARMNDDAPLSGADDSARIQGVMHVTCKVAQWRPGTALLNVRADAVVDGLVEVFFDKASVGGYRILSGGGSRPLNAFYEVRPRGVGPLPDGFCQVTVRWMAPGGEMRRIEPVLRVQQSEMEDAPTLDSDGEPRLSEPGDVPVDVIL